MNADDRLYRAPRLTRLDIQGFKSFSHRTTLAFEPGITAVVGPNGSGKSNVADALRWILGEQGQHALRAKKTEDVIFSGGQGRAPAGMAEATLTFDNSEGWLPTEFAEVSVTRRAYRSGENQYLINGRRVRLKDVAQLTASLGQSHVVVGQGLVDAALSLKAEERRGLFEHAADLTGLRLKVAEAERNLAETDANTTRLSDLLLELEPRLRTLERAAKQAWEWQGLRDRLRQLHGAHYRAELERAIAELAAMQAAEAAARSAADTAREREVRLAREHERVKQELETARERLARHEAERQEIEARLRTLVHERDLGAARLEALARRRADMDDARQGLDERVASVAVDLTKLAADLRELERITAESREAAALHTRAATVSRQARQELEGKLNAANRALVAGDRQAGDLQRRQAVLSERAGALAAEHARLEAMLHEREGRIAQLIGDADNAAAALATDDTRLAEMSDALTALANSLTEASAEVDRKRAGREQAQRRADEAATRLDVLRRMQESGAGLFGGVKTVLAAARAGQLAGVRGTVAELIVVPEQLEMAIEVALGGRLQDVVVETWAHAEVAIAHLKQRGAGRATFQPLDTVRGGRGPAVSAEVQRLGGYLGVAAELVSAQAGVERVVDALLGRTVVVDDLDTTRAALRGLGGGWSVVTLGGEIARSGGSVTGGSAVRESGTLSRERELRDLPQQVTALTQEIATANDAVSLADTTVRELHERRRQAEGEQAALKAAAEERRQQRARLRSWLSELQVEQERSERRRQELTQEQEQVSADQKRLDGEAAALAETRRAEEERRQEAERALASLLEATSRSERAASDEGRKLAGLEERLRGERRREAGLRAQERALAEELAHRAERTAQVDRERDLLTGQHASLTTAASEAEAALTACNAARAPLRDAASAAERSAADLAQAAQSAHATVVERDREQDHSGFNLERASGELQALRERIADDLEFTDPDAVLTWEVGEDPLSPSEREREIGRLRERLRRVGYVGDDAVADFERERTQQEYLREQLADVTGAAAALRDLLADLRKTMRSRFDETFAQVAEAFTQAFTTLFGGGSAQLVLATGDGSSEPGIEIVAQPPGKRLQNLALLSGGERALTAAALLFAILKVNPVPFCLLDEVDAALDEANVVRFREQLHELALQTQIIVITHNRGTIEIADTLYGVSMGADGVSQVLSLRMSTALSAD